MSENALDMIPDTVRIVSLVNNHVSDSGNPAKLVHALERRGKVVVGPGNPSVAHMTLGRRQVDFFSAYFNLPRLRVSYNGTKADALERLLLKSGAQRKIVNLHWGYEHTDVPAPFQRELAHRLVDAGADIIIGHHPHVPQGWEIYKGVPIFYSLGNFNFWQFDGETTEANRWGYMIVYELTSGDVKPVPYRINDNYQPFSVSGEEENHLMLQIQRLSETISEIDDQRWFTNEHATWYKSEMKVWKHQCLGRFSPVLWLKWIAWLCLPMQLKYYAYALRLRMCSIRRRQ